MAGLSARPPLVKGFARHDMQQVTLPRLSIVTGGDAPPPDVVVEREDTLRWRDHQDRLVALGNVIEGTYTLHVLEIAQFRFSVGDPLVRAGPFPGVRRVRVTDSFYRHVLPLWLHVHGISVLHASAVETPAGALALCAPGNTGKSTLAYGLSRRGYPLLADDAVPFRPGPDELQALPLPHFLRLRKPAARHFGAEARKLHPAAAWSEQPARPPIPFGLVLLLSRLEDRPDVPTVALEPVPALEGFPELVSHSLTFGLRDPEIKKKTLADYLALAAGVPLFRIRFASRLSELPAVLDAIEALFEEDVPQHRPSRDRERPNAT